MAEPPGQIPAGAGSGHLRASHADREQAIDTLKAAFVQGRLTKNEFDLRLGQTLASRTYADLAAITADLPAGLTAAQPSTPATGPGERAILRRRRLAMTVGTALYAGMWPLALILPVDSDGDPMDAVNLVGAATLVFLVFWVSVYLWAQAQESRQVKRASGQLGGGSGPGAHGQAQRRLASGDPGGQRRPVDPAPRRTVEAARRRMTRPALRVSY
ncbi:MAG: DUF1707 SHOCT-like domain-containing protein [Streptosporangiaceae bacterium]